VTICFRCHIQIYLLT